MPLLMILGVVLAITAWGVHPVLGIVVGFLFIGGIGWKLLFGLFGATVGRLTSSGRAAYGAKGKEFIAAWEFWAGEMQFGRTNTQPPPGAFKAWLKDNETTGISASNWIASRMQ